MSICWTGENIYTYFVLNIKIHKHNCTNEIGYDRIKLHEIDQSVQKKFNYVKISIFAASVHNFHLTHF